jgi:hypothetical protein
VVDAVVVGGAEVRRPVGVEREERAAGVEPPARAVAVGRVAEVEPAAAAEQVGVEEAELGAGAVDADGVLHRQPLAGAEDVDVLDLEAAGVDPALAAEAEPGLQRPDVAGVDLDVDPVAVVYPHRADHRVVEVAVAAQQPLGLVEHPARVRIAGGEQELVADHPLAGGAVEPVGQPEQHPVLARHLGVEDVADPHLDPVDHRARGLELVVGGERRVKTRA